MLDEMIEKASVQGYNAHQLRIDVTENPYNMITNGISFVAWRTGWFNAQTDMMEAGGEFPIIEGTDNLGEGDR